MQTIVYCNNEKCLHYQEGQICAAPEVFYVDRLCVTFRKKPRADNYRELMQPNVGICERSSGSMKRKGGGVLK